MENCSHGHLKSVVFRRTGEIIKFQILKPAINPQIYHTMTCHPPLQPRISPRNQQCLSEAQKVLDSWKVLLAPISWKLVIIPLGLLHQLDSDGISLPFLSLNKHFLGIHYI